MEKKSRRNIMMIIPTAGHKVGVVKHWKKPCDENRSIEMLGGSNPRETVGGPCTNTGALGLLVTGKVKIQNIPFSKARRVGA